MSLYATNLKNLALSLGMALFILSVIPSDVAAQRTRTDKEKVTVDRGKTKASPRTSTSSDRSTPAASKAGNQAGRGEIRGNRSTLNSGANAPIVMEKGRRASVRYAPRIYVPSKFERSYRPASRISIHIAWPWQVRYERHWSPRYRYRQVVFVQASWGRKSHSSRVEMETVYRHQVKYANEDYAVLEIDIEEVALYENGRYVGAVDRIPTSLSKIEATVYRDGRIDFDRDVFVVGDSRAGFELISTHFYDDYALARYRDSDELKVGRMDLRRGKVSRVSRSRLFDPRDFNGFAPISLLPEEEGWLWDYGVDAISAVSDDYGSYYGYNGGSRSNYASNAPLRSDSNYSYSTDFGATFKVDRKSNIQRVE
ncbi:MAG: hypothetical protein O3B41_09600 [Bacteroidetes bacterium]|nr:hypothetical protein [Bacteroidota bacterium]